GEIGAENGAERRAFRHADLTERLSASLALRRIGERAGRPADRALALRGRRARAAHVEVEGRDRLSVHGSARLRERAGMTDREAPDDLRAILATVRVERRDDLRTGRPAGGAPLLAGLA